jgi:hypothetical protein
VIVDRASAILDAAAMNFSPGKVLGTSSVVSADGSAYGYTDKRILRC